MKQLIYLENEDVAVTFSSIGKTVIMQGGQLYTVDTNQYSSHFEPYYTKQE